MAGQREREDPPEWEPPDYFTPISGENSDWEPPDYFEADEVETKKKPGIISSLLHPKPFNPSGIKQPVAEELPNPSGAERIAAANALVDPGQGDYFARHPDGNAAEHRGRQDRLAASVDTINKPIPMGPAESALYEKPIPQKIVDTRPEILPVVKPRIIPPNNPRMGPEPLTNWQKFKEGAAELGNRLIHPPEVDQYGYKIVGGPSRTPLLPNYNTMFGEPGMEVNTGIVSPAQEQSIRAKGFAKGLYENFIQPLSSEAAVFESMALGQLGRKTPEEGLMRVRQPPAVPFKMLEEGGYISPEFSAESMPGSPRPGTPRELTRDYDPSTNVPPVRQTGRGSRQPIIDVDSTPVREWDAQLHNLETETAPRARFSDGTPVRQSIELPYRMEGPTIERPLNIKRPAAPETAVKAAAAAAPIVESSVSENIPPKASDPVVAKETLKNPFEKPEAVEKVTATYDFNQPGLGDQYKIQGGPYHGSHRTAEGLRKLGIEVPQAPEGAEAAKAKEIQEAAKAAAEARWKAKTSGITDLKIPTEDKPLPIRSPNLDQPFFPPEELAKKKAEAKKNVEDQIFDIARDKFNMGRDLPIKQPPTGDIPDPKGQYYWDAEGHGEHPYEKGMWMEKDAINSDILSPIQRPEMGPENAPSVKQPPAELSVKQPDVPRLVKKSKTFEESKAEYEKEKENYKGPNINKLNEGIQSIKNALDIIKSEPRGGTPDAVQRPNITENFGGSGHPESPEYVGKVLGAAGKGAPGLSIEPVQGTNTADLNAQRVVYRGSNGEPIAVAKIVEDSKGVRLVQDLALDKTKGLAGGRAMKVIGDKLIELGATDAAGTISPDATNFRDRMKRRTPEEKLTKSGEAWKPPDYFNPDEDISYAKVKGGGLVIDTDVKRATQNLTKDYTSPLSGIMGREGAQNSLDAADKLGVDGRVRIRITRGDNGNPGMIEIHDNGSGLDETGLSEKLVRLFASGKSDDAGATGGKGIGSASYIAGGEHFEIKTVAVDSIDGKKYEIIAGGTPDQFQDPDRGSDYERKEVPANTPTGSSIKVKLKPDQDTYEPRTMIKRIIEFSRDRPSKIIFDQYAASKGDISDLEPAQYVAELHEFKSSKDDKLIGKFTLDNNEIRVQIPPSDMSIERDSMGVHFLNNGMYQFSDDISLREKVKGLPENVIVNIHPLVDEMHDDYPFINTREDLKKDLRKQIKDFIEKNITKPALDEKKNRTQEIYDSLSSVPVEGTERKPLFFDPGDRLTPKETTLFKNSTVNKDLIKHFDNVIANILGAVGRDKWGDRLEGVGISLDPDSHGMHIPNPGTGKSSIMINPFIRISSSTPKDAAFETIITALHEVGHIGSESQQYFDWSEQDTKDVRFFKYLSAYQKQILRHGDIGYSNTGHQMDFVHRLGEVFAKYGVEATFDAADALEELYTDGSETGEYSPEIQKLLQVYEKSRGRDATTEDLLTSTGVKQERKKPGSRGGDKPDGKGTPTVKGTVDKLLGAIEENKGLMEEQESQTRIERARRFANFAAVKQTGAAGAAKSLSKLAGEYDKIEREGNIMLNQQETDLLFTAIKKTQALNDYEKARAFTSLFKILNGERVPQRAELTALSEVFGQEFADSIVELHGGLGAAGLIKLAKLANTAKTMQSMMDLSAAFRQGAGLLYRKEFAPAFKDMIGFYFNKDFYEVSMKMMEADPEYKLARESELFLSKPGTWGKTEEAFLNSYVGDLPKGPKGLYIGSAIRGTAERSERAYTGFLNKLRFDTFKAMVKQAKGLGHEAFTVHKDEEGNNHIVPGESSIRIARFINNASGRGSLGRWSKYAEDANFLLWSPRNIASRVQMFLNPSLYMKLPKGMRRQGLYSLFGIASMSLIVQGLAAAAGAKLTFDMLSSDFMKARFRGNKVMDPNASVQQYIVTARRIIAGKTDSPVPTTRAKIAGRFLANKLSPAASLGLEIATSKFTGTQKNPSWNMTTEFGEETNLGRMVGKQFAPMFGQDLKELIWDDPEWAENVGLNSVMAFEALMGMGIQIYPEKNTSKMKFRKMKLQ